MGQRWFVAVVGCWLATASAAEEPRMPLRSLARFELDAATTHGLWAEALAFLEREEEGDGHVDLITVGPRLVYGLPYSEVGLLIPYHFFSVDIPFANGDEDGLGDLRIYGKGVYDSELFAVGGGLDISFPSGSDTFTADEVGFLPFGTFGVHAGPVDVRAHIGYRAFTGSGDDFDEPADSIVYGGGLFAPIGDFVAVRAEFQGQDIQFSGDDANPVSFQPGVDVRIPIGQVDLLLRPTGAVGVTDDAADWGVGGSIAVLWDPNRPL